MSKVDVTFLITSYNYEKYVEECIFSCLNQIPSGLNFEVILVDDGSKDGTFRVVDKISKQHKNFFVFRIDNIGIEGAANFGFKNAHGDFIVRVDADDRLHNNYLMEISKNLEANIDFYYSNYTVIDENGRVIEVSSLPIFDPKEIFRRGDFLAGGTMYSRGLFEGDLMYESEWVNSGLENYELVLKLLMSGKRGKLVSENLFDYRRHSLNMSALNVMKIIKNGQRLFDKYGLGRYSTNNYHPYKLKI